MPQNCAPPQSVCKLNPVQVPICNSPLIWRAGSPGSEMEARGLSDIHDAELTTDDLFHRVRRFLADTVSKARGGAMSCMEACGGGLRSESSRHLTELQ
ncbi:hypothetical protein NPIL_28871 [Nephila pilipes]|uniref:Uncharacterized protein n=1 Tax=Nephila pilipes TaxID=299642 RepID=A0A8X6M8K1_NEPPI|nr:hypothetical protein NPIL_28871 [Nephila pilipes]